MQVCPAARSFAALRNDGSVVTWGDVAWVCGLLFVPFFIVELCFLLGSGIELQLCFLELWCL